MKNALRAARRAPNVVLTKSAAVSLPAAPTAAEPELKEGFPDIVTRSDALVVRAIRESAREVDFVASTDVVDSHYEIIDQESWDLRDYETNPVVLYGHQSYELPIGQATKVGVVNGQLICTIRFSDATQRAKEVWALVLEKTLRAVSVGFRPVNGAYEMRNGDEVWVWRNSKLKEISVVAVPANPEALAKMKAAARAAAAEKDPRAGLPAPVTATRKAGSTGEKENDDMKTVEQLQKEIEETKAEGAKKLTDVNIKLVEAEARAEKADAARSVAEKALLEASEKVKGLELAAKTLEGEHTKACADRDANAKRAEDAEGKLVELEVSSLVGKKISAAEKDEFVELRRSNKSLFEKMVSKRADMKLEDRVTQTDEAVNAKGESKIQGDAAGGVDPVSAFNAL